jgi:hypothetical protein
MILFMQKRPHGHFATKLLTDLADQTAFIALGWFSLASWEFPESCQMHSRWALSNQQSGLGENKGCGDFDGNKVLHRQEKGRQIQLVALAKGVNQLPDLLISLSLNHNFGIVGLGLSRSQLRMLLQ